MSTPIIQTLIPHLRQTVQEHLLAYLEKGGELSSIYDSLEFWYDRYRDSQHPELPMWSDLPSSDVDQLFDAWIAAVQEYFVKRSIGSDPKWEEMASYTISGDLSAVEGSDIWKAGKTLAGFLHENPDVEKVVVSRSQNAAAASSASLLVKSFTEPLKPSQGGSVCEVEPLGEIASDDWRKEFISFVDFDGDKCSLNYYADHVSICSESGETGALFSRSLLPSLIAHLSAWLDTGSFKLVPRVKGSDSAGKDELIREAWSKVDKIILYLDESRKMMVENRKEASHNAINLASQFASSALATLLKLQSATAKA